MYTIVVLAALGTGGEVADRHRCGGGGYCGCYGGYSGCYGGYYGGYGGCYGGYSSCYTPCYSYAYSCQPMMYHPAAPAHDGKDKMKDKKGRGEEETSLGNAAQIVVTLPDDAKLTIDGQPTTSTSSRRVFVSPELEQGKNYHYMLKATVMRDGKPVEVEKKVSVRAGQETDVTIDMDKAHVAAR
jgi:uncharacterized protein (TIGR03000 family)